MVTRDASARARDRPDHNGERLHARRTQPPVRTDRGRAGGIAPSTTAFHALAVFEHGAAGLVGLVAFGLLAAATVVTSATLLARQIWRGAAIVGLLAALTLPILDVLQAGYAFMLPFALWELLIAANAAKTRDPFPQRQPIGPGRRLP